MQERVYHSIKVEVACAKRTRVFSQNPPFSYISLHSQSTQASRPPPSPVFPRWGHSQVGPSNLPRFALSATCEAASTRWLFYRHTPRQSLGKTRGIEGRTSDSPTYFSWRLLLNSQKKVSVVSWFAALSFLTVRKDAAALRPPVQALIKVFPTFFWWRFRGGPNSLSPVSSQTPPSYFS